MRVYNAPLKLKLLLIVVGGAVCCLLGGIVELFAGGR